MMPATRFVRLYVCALFLFTLSVFGCTGMNGPVHMQSPGEVAADLSVKLRIAIAGADSLLTAGTLKPAAALQLADSVLAANASLRLYYDMSDCKALQAMVSAFTKNGAAVDAKSQALVQSADLACAQFNGKPFDEVAQLELAQSALTVLSQTLHSAAGK